MSYPKSGTHTRTISEPPLLCRKKGWREPPSDKFWKSQQIHSMWAFQTGRSALSEITSRAGGFANKIDLKETCFSVPPSKNSQKFLRFQWSGNLYEFLCPCFGLGLALRIFKNLLKVPIGLLKLVNIRIIIYLDNVLLMGKILPEILMARDTFLL